VGQQSSSLFVWDLRLLRAQLAELNLDWNQSSLPAAPRPGAQKRVVFDFDPSTAAAR